MIAIWTLSAILLSILPLVNKKIDLPYYMWILLPIDVYGGLMIAGATIKPYMIFAAFLPIILCAKNKNKDFSLTAGKGELMAGIVTVLILAQSVFTESSFAAVSASIMLILVYVCAQMYVSCTDCSKSEQLSDVFIAAAFGCGIVFTVAYILLQCGVELQGIVTTDRTADGMIMQMHTMNNGTLAKAYRLRGFAYDPNTMFVTFIYAISACTSRLFKKFNLYYVFTLIISIVCIILSSSRMGLICCAVAIVITSVVSISQFETIKNKVLSVVAILFGSTGVLIVLMSNWGQAMLSSLLSSYQNRSGLTDEYGRFSVWKECLAVFWEKNPLWGVGLGNMPKLTATERMTHNTWLEFLCECGAIVGGIVIIFFLTVLIIGWAKVGQKHREDPDNTSYLCTIIGYTTTIISLVSVDNISHSYLWFGALLVLKLAFYKKPIDNAPKGALDPHSSY